MAIYKINNMYTWDIYKYFNEYSPQESWNSCKQMINEYDGASFWWQILVKNSYDMDKWSRNGCKCKLKFEYGIVVDYCNE